MSTSGYTKDSMTGNLSHNNRGRDYRIERHEHFAHLKKRILTFTAVFKGSLYFREEGHGPRAGAHVRS